MPLRAAAERLQSLDVFRGLTMAAMLVVNNPGSWTHVFSPLRHAEWHGLTPTDLVFPFFLFIVGAAMPFSFDRRIAAGASRVRLFEHVVRRALTLVLLGLTLNAWPRWPEVAPFFGLADAWDWSCWRPVLPYVLGIIGLSLLFADEPPLGWPSGVLARIGKLGAWLILAAAVAWFVIDYHRFTESRLRVPGVLQRIGLCYLFASMVVLVCCTRGRLFWALALAGGYWAILAFAHAPADYETPLHATRPLGVLHDWIDVRILGTHLYGERPDPEGLLSTLPAISTVLFGALAGAGLRSRMAPESRAAWLFIAANVLLVAGLWIGLFLPINKKIWTSSYVFVTAGLALHLLATCYWLVDVQAWRGWARPFMVLGTNAIAVYCASGIAARWLATAPITPTDGTTTILKTYLYETIAARLVPAADGITASAPAGALAEWGANGASLAYALGYAAIFCLLFAPLYWRRIYIRV